MSIKIETRAISDTFAPLSEQVKKNGAGGDFGALLNVEEFAPSSASLELKEYLDKSLEERTAIAMRKQLGISEEEYAAMTPDEKKAVDAQVADLLKQKLEEQVARKQAEANRLQSGIVL